MKKIIALLLIFSIISLYGNLYAKEKRGVNVEVFKTTLKMETPWDTQTPDIKGELIAVKKNSLLLLESNGADVSVDVADIKLIKIVKKSKVLIGGGIGFAMGVILSIPYSAFLVELHGGNGDLGSYFLFAGICGAVLLFPGMLIGALISSNKTIKLEGKSEAEIEKALEDLRKIARVPDFQ